MSLSPMSELIIVEPALRWSGVLRRKLDANPAFSLWLESAAQHPVTRKTIPLWLDELKGAAADSEPPATMIRRVLRQLRERVFFTLMVRDIAGLAPLHEVVAAMSALADLAVSEAYQLTAAELAATHGTPLDPATGKPQELLLLGMGKLGGRELNVSSDIDLIALYGEEGETNGRRSLSHHEFYGRVVQRMMPVLSEIDAFGQVFRTDLRLRPDGDSGPLAWSLDALENYLVAQGREWERYAWLKARPILCRAFEGSDPSAQWHQLEALRVPFVYRKYFDFDALAALRSLRERIRQDWQRRALARNGIDATHNIKLGEGGIREIEFVVQLNQLIRGGRRPSLQQRSLQAALYKQRRAGVMPPEDANRLEAAYVFLRRVEHRLQYREDEQTHLLPRDAGLRQELAASMQMSPEAFEETLQAHRSFVSQAFRNAFRIAGMQDPETASSEPAPEADLETRLQDCLGQDCGVIGQRMQTLLESPRLRSLQRTSRDRVKALMPRLLEASASTAHPVQTATRLLDLVEAIAPRSAYLALLAEYPDTLARVARIVSASPWASQYLERYPLLLDGLIEWRSLMLPLDLAQVAQQLKSDLDACLLPDGRPDVEQQMNLMRDCQRQTTFQLLAQDLEGILSIEALADQLSALADLLLRETIQRVWPLVQPKGTDLAQLEPPHFAILAYGRLGGKELGYASDLDLVFLYQDTREDATELYTRLGRRIVSWLSTLTSSGRLYDIDLRLRPDGDAGLLAVSVDAFERYQKESAWAWEHQALTRARYAAGDPAIGAKLEALRREILLRPREAEALKNEIRSMRERISAGHPNPTADFDLKHDRGGMVDIEFITQYLVLMCSNQHPILLENLGNIALLGIAGQAGLIPADLATPVADAYRTFRRMQHALRLQGAEKVRIGQDQLLAERNAVIKLWNHVIGA